MTYSLSSLDPGRVRLHPDVAAAALLRHNETLELSTAPGTDDGALARALRLAARTLEVRTEDVTDPEDACRAEYAFPVGFLPEAYEVQCDRRAHPDGGPHHAHRRHDDGVIDVSWADQ